MKKTIKTALGILLISTATAQFTIPVSSIPDLEKKEKAAKEAKPSFTVTRIINAPADKVWKVVGEDYALIANSHPILASSGYAGNSMEAGEGCERVCNLNEKGNKYTKERQVDYDPENYSFTAEVYEAGGLPLNNKADNWAKYKVIPIDDNTSKLIIDSRLITNPAFMGKLFRGKFKKTIEDYTIAIQHHVLTGEKVSKENFKEIKKKYKS